MNDTDQENLGQTLARELKQPSVLINQNGLQSIALPPGWKTEHRDDSKLLDAPRRKTAKVRLNDAESFIAYMKRHGSLTDSTIWCQADYKAGAVQFTGIINDHGEDEAKPAWRDHQALYAPTFSAEWERWLQLNAKQMSQADFAAFIETNLRDIASPADSGLPTGGQMLEMAIDFEANQEKKFKSAIRLQSGGITMNFTESDDQQTIQKMQMFDRFAIGIPVFWNGDAYQIDARLRYRVREGKLAFWYELSRQDKTLQDATETLIKTIKDKTGSPFFYGQPFIS